MKNKIKQMFTLKNLPFRIMIIFLILFPFIYWQNFYFHIYAHFTGTILPVVIMYQWHIVIINILIFLTFLIPLSFRRKINWKEYGLVTAFFVSLFVEMYGIPLTLLFLSKSVNSPVIEMAPLVYEFEFLGVDIGMDMAMTYAIFLMVLGTIFIIVGWINLYKDINKEKVVTTGIYSISRHPQYFGFLLLIIGWLIGWPTILTVIFSVILFYKYIKVCKIEENELSNIKKYNEYKKQVPFLI
jgi:protein-S-isoprenylcysteine O-methyltransferase Ste14